ncbi:hypothetical protein ECANGB1_487 [Enterospora canceri]|uniref:N-acetyltransferase domain-containing protein n=1 Tax=Enterospora canceri TaxID=1081671 RepID=A0A1Y1S4F6_9MICR|nr:hypothetical protein ECANGB1_487 [Enterospora canceri]
MRLLWILLEMTNCAIRMLRNGGIEYRCVKLDCNRSAVQSVKQMKPHLETIDKIFKGNVLFNYSTYNNTHIFMLLNGTELVAYLELKPTILVERGWRGKRTYKNFTFYMVCVPEKYRRKGFCKILMDFAVKSTISENGTKDVFFSMHLNSEDLSAPVSAKTYYQLGFRRAMWARYSFEEYIHSFENFRKNSVDLYELMKDETKGSGTGGMVALCCEAKDYASKKWPVPENFYELGRSLMTRMDARRRTYDSTFSG